MSVKSIRTSQLDGHKLVVALEVGGKVRWEVL